MSTYDHLLFSRHWNLSSKTHYELGQCDAIVQAIANAPLLPEYHRRLLLVSLTKGAQATTAIEGNTLSEEEIERVVEGKSLPPSKQYQEQEVRNILEAFNILLQEVKWCGHASVFAAGYGEKPWTYLLVPHDEITASATLQGLAARW